VILKILIDLILVCFFTVFILPVILPRSTNGQSFLIEKNQLPCIQMLFIRKVFLCIQNFILGIERIFINIPDDKTGINE